LHTYLIWNDRHIDEIKRQREAAFVKNNAMMIDEAAKKII